MQRTRSKSNKTAAKSTNVIHILPLITVWLQVRVLSGPPTNQSLNRFSFRRLLEHRTRNAPFSHSLNDFNGIKLLLRVQSDHDPFFSIADAAA
jgi:hypothetical protein